MHLNRKLNSVLIILGFLSLVSCGENKKSEIIIARVGDAVLTKSQLEKALASDRYKRKYKEEFIRQWIETELLFKKAIDENILSDSLFNEILSESKKELAGALLITKKLNEKTFRFTEKELRDYYKKNRSEFLAPYDGYVLNIAKFNSQNDAINFRKEVLKNKWKYAGEKFKDKNSLINIVENKLIYKYEIQPVHLLRVIEKLAPDVVSIIIKTDENEFTVVQMIDNIKQNKPVPAKYIWDEISERLKIFKQKQFYNKFLESLYEEYSVQLKRDSL